MTATRAIETLMLCGCSRCGRRLVYPDHSLPCVVDAQGTPTAVRCWECDCIVEAGRAGQEAALAGEPLDAFRFKRGAERQEFEAEYQRTLAILGRTT